MTPPNRNVVLTKRPRNVSNVLCVLIQELECTDENIAKFHELIGEGADINFKNSSEDDCTPLHLAIYKHAVAWIRLLLDNGADMTVANKEGKTPKSLADELQNCDVISLFYNAKLKKFDKRFVRATSYASLKVTSLEEFLSYHSTCAVRVLKITECPTLREVVELMIQPGFYQIFNRSSSLFTFIIEVQQLVCSSELFFFLQLLDKKFTKPTILQISNEHQNEIFFKDVNKEFKKLDISSDAGKEASSFNFEFFCNLVQSRPHFFGKLDTDLMKITINTEESIEGLRLIDYAVQHGDLLTLNFLQLFDPDLETLNDNYSRVLEVAARCGNVEALKLLLDVPGNDFEFALKPEYRRVLELKSHDNVSLLMIAAEAGHFEFVKFLVKCGVNVNQVDKNGDNVSDIAWKARKYDVIVKILKADGPFPRDFETSRLNIKNGFQAVWIKLFSLSRDELHFHIRNNSCLEIRKFLSNFSKVRYAYNSQNRCALSTALEVRNFETYSFLRSRGFSTGLDATCEMILQNFTIDEKQTLRDSNCKYFKTNDNAHIMDLLAKSSLGYNSDQSYFSRIQNLYEKLDRIEGIQTILKVVSNAKDLRIVFDFNYGSIFDLDPTGVRERTRGRTYHGLGTIFIGAKRDSEQELLGTLAHELAHYAIQLVYMNSCEPYHKEDEARREMFLRIVNMYDNSESKSRSELIARAFATQDLNYRIAELIVRPPHLMALYSNDPEKLSALRQRFIILFDFFENFVLKDFTSEFPLMKEQRKIKELNQLLGVHSEAASFEMILEDCRIESQFKAIVSDTCPVIVACKVPKLILSNMIKYLARDGRKNIVSSFVFIHQHQLMDAKYFKEVQNAFFSECCPKIFIINSNDSSDSENIRKILVSLKTRVVLITSHELFPLNVPGFSYHMLDFHWDDLSDTTQMKLLNSKVSFQNHEIALNEILTKESEFFHRMSIEQIPRLQEVCIKQPSIASSDFYIERTFERISNGARTVLKQKVVEMLLQIKRAVIISDEAGMGKTTSATHFSSRLKERNPSCWVVFLDLKQYTTVFYQDHDKRKCEEVGAKFMGENLLKLTSELELKLFHHFYESGKVIFIVDGFDEISPSYKDFVLKIITAVKASYNRLLITTRLHLTKTLEENLGVVAIKLKPFSLDDQINFLLNFWHKKDRRKSLCVLKSLASSLLDTFRKYLKSHTKDDFFRVPLQVRMLAEIYDETNLGHLESMQSSFNLYTFYSDFITKKIKVWMEKGPLAIDESTKIHKSSQNVIQVHQKAALEYFFDKSVIHELKLQGIPKTLSKELISRIGMLQIFDDGKCKFMHQTIAEYFVADFVIFNAVTNETLLSASAALHRIFLDVLLEEKFGQIRKFMNDQLELLDDVHTEILSSMLEQNLRLDENRGILFHLIKKRKKALMTFILKTLDFDKKLKLQLIEHKLFRGDGALHIAAACGDYDVFTNLCHCIETFADADDLKQLFMSQAKDHRNVLGLSISGTNLSLIGSTLESAIKIMDEKEFEKFLITEDLNCETALDLAMNGTNPKILTIVWNAIELKLDEEHQKKLLVEKGKTNVLTNATRPRNESVFRFVLDIFEKLFRPDEVEEILFDTETHGSSALQVAARWHNEPVFAIIWKFVQKTVKSSQQKALWLQENRDGKNILMKSVWNSDNTVAEKILQVSKSILDCDEMQKVLTLKDDGGKNVLHLAVASGNFVAFKLFWKAFTESFTADQLKSTLLERNADHQNVLEIAAALNDQSFHNSLTDIFKEVFAENEHFILFDQKESVLMAEYPIEDNIEILRQFKEVMENEMNFDQLRSLLAQPEARLILHKTVFFGSVKFISNLLIFISVRLNRKEQQRLLTEKDLFGRNILHCSLYNENLSAVGSLWNYTVSLIDPQTIKQFLLEDDEDCQNFFHLAAMWSNNSLTSKVLEWFKSNSEPDELKKVFYSRDNRQRILIHYVAQRCDKNAMEKFFNFTRSVFDAEELKNMIFDQNEEGENSLWYSLRNSANKNISSFKAFWKSITSILKADELEQLIFEKNYRGEFPFNYGGEREKMAIDELRASITIQFGEDLIGKLVIN